MHASWKTSGPDMLLFVFLREYDVSCQMRRCRRQPVEWFCGDTFVATRFFVARAGHRTHACHNRNTFRQE